MRRLDEVGALHSFTHSFNKYVLSAYHMPGPVLGIEGANGDKKDEVPALVELNVLEGK